MSMPGLLIFMLFLLEVEPLNQILLSLLLMMCQGLTKYRGKIFKVPIPMPRLLIFVVTFVGSVASRPNILLIVADDLGWNDVSFHGSNQIPTPNLDILAYDGIILNNYYTAHLCTPSRGSLMTGKYPTRLGLQHRVIEVNEPYGLPLSEKTLPQYLKELGYATHGIGKWHLGFFEEAYTPTKRGFDTYFGYWSSMTDYYTHFAESNRNVSGYDFHDNEDVADFKYIGQYSTELFTEKAEHIIRDHNYTQPLFLFISHQAVHTGNEDDPLQVPEDYTLPFYYIEDKDRKIFAGMASALDLSVGKTLEALDESHVLNNTIIVFTTDNGGSPKTMMNGTSSNYPLRGAKFTLFEGGTRAVAFIWSQELRKNNRVLRELMHITDWVPTLYAAAGANADELKDLDGYNQWPSISRGDPSSRQGLLYNIDPIENAAAIRNKKYKLIRANTLQGKYDGWFDEEGNNISEFSRIQKYFSSQGNDHQQSDLLYQITNSQTYKVLSKNYGSHFFNINSIQNDELIVDCQLQNQDIQEPCKPAEKPCLFDIEKDPCEFNNLASRLPEIVAELTDLLQVQERRSIPPGNKPADPLANPIFHNNCFVSWK